MEESLNWENGIRGITMRRCSFSQEENSEFVHSSNYSVKENFLKEYQNHIAGMEIAAECAKVFIEKNWKEVKDWSKLNVVIEDASKKHTEYFNYVPMDREKHKNSQLWKTLVRIDKSDSKRHNPIVSFTDVVLDPTDGDFSVTINGKVHLWVSDDSVIVIANYIEEQLIKQK